MKNTRRNFLKQTLAGTSLAVSGLVSNSLLAEKKIQAMREWGECEFNGIKSGLSYFNTGTEGSMPDCVMNSLHHAQKQWARDPTTSYETDKSLGKHQHENREFIAKSLNVKKNNICLTDNTTMGMNMVLMGLNFKPTDKVILTNHEHNAIVSPLTVHQDRIGLALIEREFPSAASLSTMDAAAIIEFLFPNIAELKNAKALCVSHVYPTTGVRLPLNLLRKKADQLGIKYLVVDGAQAFGMIDLSAGDDAIDYADFYGCPGHKWLNAAPSTGVLYIKNEKIQPPEFYPIMSQRMPKYRTNNQTIESNFPMAEALQVRGCSNAPGFVAMRTAIDFQLIIGGYKTVEQQILSKSNRIKWFIKSRAPKAIVSPSTDQSIVSGLTVFFPFSWKQPNKIYQDEATAKTVVEYLLAKNIQIRYIGFNDPSSKNKLYALRVSTAIFNDDLQISQLQKELEKAMRTI